MMPNSLARARTNGRPAYGKYIAQHPMLNCMIAVFSPYLAIKSRYRQQLTRHNSQPMNQYQLAPPMKHIHTHTHKLKLEFVWPLSLTSDGKDPLRSTFSQPQYQPTNFPFHHEHQGHMMQPQPQLADPSQHHHHHPPAANAATQFWFPYFRSPPPFPAMHPQQAPNAS